ncbi:MAG: histidine triad nucleotide-binding protein [Firmicutes bacterium]|nr:histidine triad nucleotide-binding protein [Bacillota bacterium]
MPAEECVFCRIVAKQIPSEIVYEDEHVVAFRDINPQAPTHLLVIPRRHIPSLVEVTEDDIEVLGRLQYVASLLAKEHGFADDGFRTVLNCGQHGQQTVFHIHLHVLGGRQLTWPPG